MRGHVHDTPDLELALLRRGVDERAAERERCGLVHRTPLVGERVYLYESGVILCELCRVKGREEPAGSRLVHGPEFGNTIRIADHRAA